MAVTKKDLLSRLADAGEEALGRLSDAPTADRFAGPVRALRDRVDELGRRMRGLDALEGRVAELERRLADADAASSARSVPARPSTKASGPGV